MSDRTRTTTCLLGAGIFLLLATGFLAASNMAFKLHYPLREDSNPLALPWIRMAGIDTAKDLMVSININGVPSWAVERYEGWIPETNSVILYVGAPTDPHPGPLLESGVGFWMRLQEDASYVITGAHDPALDVTFLGHDSSESGTNFYAPPYHSALADGMDLIDDINANGVPPDSVERLEYWLVGSASRYAYAGGPTDPPAPPFVQGEAVFVKVGASDVVYRPSHY